MPKETLLSIVTVTYNDKAALAATLESCRKQNCDINCEFIVVDGESTDGTGEIIQGYEDLLTIAISESDRGIYDAMNKGLQLASGQYVMYLNAGDIWSDELALQAVCDSLVEAKPTWLVCGALSLEGGKRKRVIKNIPHSWLRHALGLQAHCHQSTVIRRDLMEAIGGFSEEYDFAGDFDLILRVGLIDKPAYLRRIVVTYAGGGISSTRGREISTLQRKVRSERMQLGPFAELLNGMFMRYHMARRALIPLVVRFRSLRNRSAVEPIEFQGHV